MQLAPIVLFVYNRPDHTRKTVEALQNNKFADQSNLVIFSDAPKNEKAKEGVEKVRKYIKNISGFKSVAIVERLENFGLAKSIINGVTEVINKYGSVIVLEDDLITSPYFLAFMNEGLRVYEGENRVFSIHGYIYPIKGPRPETFFLQEIDCWGWATWKREWDLFEADGKKLLMKIRQKRAEEVFDLNNSYHFTLMLREQILGLSNSWAIRWYASAFLAHKFGLYPRTSLVKNIGMDDSGVHTGSLHIFDVELSRREIFVEKKSVEEDKFVAYLLECYFKAPKHILIFKLLRLKSWIRVSIKTIRNIFYAKKIY